MVNYRTFRVDRLPFLNENCDLLVLPVLIYYLYSTVPAPYSVALPGTIIVYYEVVHNGRSVGGLTD